MSQEQQLKSGSYESLENLAVRVNKYIKHFYEYSHPKMVPSFDVSLPTFEEDDCNINDSVENNYYNLLQSCDFFEAARKIYFIFEFIINNKSLRVDPDTYAEIERILVKVDPFLSAIGPSNTDKYFAYYAENLLKVIKDNKIDSRELLCMCQNILQGVLCSFITLNRNLQETNSIISYASTLNNKLLKEEQQIDLLIDNMRKKFSDFEGVLIDKSSKSLATFFSKQAKNHNFYSMIWLIAYGLSILGLIGYSIFIFISIYAPKIFSFMPTDVYNQENKLQLISMIAAKIIGFTILSTISFFIAKNYKAHKHQYVLAQFRENLLKTAECIMLIGGENQQIKNALLAEVFKSVCTEKASGYVTTEDVEPKNSTDLLHLMEKLK